MDESEVKTQVEKAVNDELDKLRLQAVDDLKEIVGPPPKISPEEAASLLGVSYSTIYRYLGTPFSKLYLPQVDQVPMIAAFIGRVADLREAWLDVLAGWRADANEDVKAVFYHPRLVELIEGSLPMDEKLRRLVKLTVRALARAAEAEK